MKAAIIENNIVVNVVMVDSLDFPVADGQELVIAEKVDGQPVAEKGWIRQPDGTFAPEAE